MLVEGRERAHDLDAGNLARSWLNWQDDIIAIPA